MTLPTNINFPLRLDANSDQDIDRYLRDLVFELQNMYESVANNVNGSIRSYAEVDQAQWTPMLQGTGSGTFTYSSQVDWSIRSGIYTELFFDITWSATTATGNLYLELPYKVLPTDGMPFVGVVQASSVAFGAGNSYLVINAISDSYRGEFWTCGSSVATANLSVPASGRLIGSLKFIGLEDL